MQFILIIFQFLKNDLGVDLQGVNFLTFHSEHQETQITKYSN